MKLCKAMLLGGLLLAVPAVQAQGTFPVDGIGIYFDQEGIANCSYAPSYTLVTAYLVVTQLTEASGLSGWQLRFATNPDPPPAGISFSLMQPGVSILPPPTFEVLLSAAVPQAPTITLLSMTLFHMGIPIDFAVGPTDPSLFPTDPGPCYAVGDDPSTWRRLSVWEGAPLTGQPGMWIVAGLGQSSTLCSPDPVEPLTWGALKRLYD